MDNRKYVVSSGDIYVGEVIKTSDIYQYEFKNGKKEIISGAYYSLRSILFVLNEKGYAEDLIYNSPNYPVLNMTDDKECLSLGENSIVIQNALNLEQLLNYFGYKCNLTFYDVMKIRRRFFTGYFGKNNCELFGMKELRSEEGSRVSYVKTNWAMLNPKYFSTLDDRGDHFYGFLLGDVDKANAFKPNVMEGPVKKLKRF